MKIEHVCFSGLGPLIDHRADLTLGGNSRSSLCLRGPNGAGKSTWLRAVHQLWGWFRRSCTVRRPTEPSPRDRVPKGSTLGMLVGGLAGPDSHLWIWQGSPLALAAERQRHEGPGRTAPSVVSLDEAGLLAAWDQAFVQAEGGGNSLPNVLLLEAEGRFLPPLRSGALSRPSPTPAWIAAPRYRPSDRGEALEGVMRTLALARRDRWVALCDDLRDLLPGIRLLDAFDEATLRPLFELSNGQRLFADQLSAGEISLLISIVTIARFASPGAVVLLDEPELHQHLSLMRGSLAALEELVVDHLGGQLIVASHAPEVWDHFRAQRAWVDLPGRGP